MPWTRTGDNAATYPALMQTAGHRGTDERTVNEVAGFVFRCAFQSAAHMTDYSIDAGTVQMIGGARWRDLVKICERAQLLEVSTKAGVKSWRLIEDPEFIHIRLREEVEWERQQRNDTRDPAIKVPVLRRDGDNCRWCGVLVQWRGKTTNRTGTLDHLVPGQAGTPETMVVACKGCNSARKDNPQWDDDHVLRPAPAHPLYGRHTAEYLTTHGYPTDDNLTGTQRPATGPGADTAPDGVRSATATGAGTAASAAATAERPGREVHAKSPPKSSGHADGSTPAGSGRDGSALGSTPNPSPTEPGAALPARPRRRGRRGSGRSSQTSRKEA